MVRCAVIVPQRDKERMAKIDELCSRFCRRIYIGSDDMILHDPGSNVYELCSSIHLRLSKWEYDVLRTFCEKFYDPNMLVLEED